MRFLILSSFILFGGGCAHGPAATSFDGKWQFCEATPFQPPLACLPEADLQTLREILIRCEAPK